MVTGRKFLTEKYDAIRHIRRIILPDPNSDSLKFYSSSIYSEDAVRNHILEATRVCSEEFGIRVRWCPQHIQSTFMLGDAEKRSGWLHAEMVLPFSRANLRPSFTAKKERFPELVDSYQTIFEALWDQASEPQMKVVAPLQRSEIISISKIMDRLTSDPWILNFNPSSPNGKKAITFLPDGNVGIGSNANEFAWELSDDHLSIYRKGGELQNEFIYEPRGERFVCVNKASAKGIRDQIIYRDTPP